MDIIYIDENQYEAFKMDLSEKKIAEMFKALGDENRIRIMRILKGGEKCACVLLEDLHISQPTLSHHMKILCDSAIVNGRKQGKWIYYSISSQVAQKAFDALEEVTEGNIRAH